MFVLYFVLLCLVTSQDKPTQSSEGDVSNRTCLKISSLWTCALKSKGQQPPICHKDKVPRCKDGCPSCIPSEMLGRCETPPTSKCTDDMVYPVVNDEKKTMCPPCYFAKDSCTEAKALECRKKLEFGKITKCADGERPETKDCCVSCLAFNKNITCTLPTKKCKPDQIGLRDIKGCRMCVPETPVRPVDGKCSQADFRKHKEIVPECDTSEKPVVNMSIPTCGPPCVRPASKKHLLEVIACKKKLPNCTDDDSSKRDFFLPDHACPVCEPRKPRCSKVCNSEQVCIRSRSNDKKCVRKRRIVLRMNVTNTVYNTSVIKNMSKADMAGVLKELLQRFCERNDQVSRCKRSLERILDSLKCAALKKMGNKTFEVDLEVAESESADYETTELLEDAVKDDDTTIARTESTPPSKIPLEKMCFVPDNIVKCRMLGVKMAPCEKERPKCERKAVSARQNKFLMVCPSCIPDDYVDHLCKKATQPCAKDMQKKREEMWDSEAKSICPTCIKVQTDECSWEEKKKCLAKLKSGAIPPCVENEVAIRKDCCVSCQLAVKPMEKECATTDLPECDDPTEDKTDKRDAIKREARDVKGCRRCAPKGPWRKVSKRCSGRDFRQYKALVPSCSSGERVFVNPNSTRCGPPCVRPATKKNLLQVIACVKNLRDCETEDESNRRTFLPNAACSICEPKRPNCGCGDKQVCIRHKQAGQNKKRCVNKKKFTLTLTLARAIANKTQELDKKAFTRVLLEFVERFCERNSQFERCSRFLDVIRDSLKCINKIRKSDLDVEAEVELAEDESATGRRLLAEDSIVQFMVDASSDDDTYVESAGSTTYIDLPPMAPPTPASTASTVKSSIYLTLSVLAIHILRF